MLRAAQVSHWGAINMTKAALTDPRINPDPEQLVRMLSGTCRDQEDLLTGSASIAPLYAAPDEIKGQAVVDAEEVIGRSIKPFYETVNAALNDCVSCYDVQDRLQDIKAPAFISVGSHDWITPVPCSEFTAENISNSKLVIYEKSGHMAALEQKTPLQRDVREDTGRSQLPGVSWAQITPLASRRYVERGGLLLANAMVFDKACLLIGAKHSATESKSTSINGSDGS
ncbi:hypothetical protein LTR36_008168 [Oleoguttula mirabilis]|uniref:Uncharacterized protein n=1 Tax=Oleoguttula mirabilis TaxID=1507867 RepID=A0AAV9J849_9PEZI|nr:hypothetical protein LTR36_008168 [Oleoguttula mirabilis]